MIKVVVTIIGFFGILLLAGCDSRDKTQELYDYIADVKSRPPEPIEPLPQFRGAVTFEYDAGEFRSPFEPRVMRVLSTVKQPDMKRPRDALENFPLDAMRMVGVISQGDKVWALITAPNGTVHSVGVGSYMGKNYGKVVGIGDEAITLIETVPDKFGGWEEREAYLSAQQPVEE